jgi:glutamate synthase (NADPH/NADH) small chain
MPDPRGFLVTDRATAPRIPVDVRIRSWSEVYEGFDPQSVSEQAGRCMDCGIPFCHHGCPLGNIIPEWNDQVWRGDWRAAGERLHSTNNFPEVTGRLCPAPCESACVAGIGGDAVAIKQVEVGIADRIWESGGATPLPPSRLTERTVAIVGSGPAGLAAAQQLTRAGHTVVVYERDDRIGGLLRYGIPEFKLEKRWVDRRLEQMVAEGTRFQTRVDVGVDLTLRELRRRFDAVVLAIGSTLPRELDLPGRRLAGVHHAMEFLTPANRVQQGDLAQSPIHAEGKHVVIIGGGDTGSDCLGTAHRQGAASVTSLEILPEPASFRDASTPWPTWPLMLRTSSAHEEGGDRLFAVSTTAFVDDGKRQVGGIEVVDVEATSTGFTPDPSTARLIGTDLVLLALGFVGPDTALLQRATRLQLDQRRTIQRDEQFHTDELGVFVAGDAGRGQSLVVWAIAEGRSCASEVDRWLAGSTTLPAPVRPSDRPLSL